MTLALLLMHTEFNFYIEKFKMKQLNILASIKDPTAKHGNLGDMFGYLLLEHYCAQYSVNINCFKVGLSTPSLKRQRTH